MVVERWASEKLLEPTKEMPLRRVSGYFDDPSDKRKLSSSGGVILRDPLAVISNMQGSLFSIFIKFFLSFQKLDNSMSSS